MKGMEVTALERALASKNRIIDGIVDAYATGVEPDREHFPFAAKIASTVSLLRCATRFEIPPSPEVHAKLFPPGFTNGPPWTIRVEARGDGKWVLFWPGGDCLTRDLTWEYEPLPSNRSDEFLARTRFSLDAALTLLGRSDLATSAL